MSRAILFEHEQGRYIINSFIYQIMDHVMWPVSVTQLGIYYIRKRLLHVPTAFHGHGATMQLNGFSIFT